MRVFHWQFLITYVFSVSLKFGACCITGQWGEFKVSNAILCLHILFWYFFVFFHQKIVFIIFISFFDEVSSFRNRILTNQKPELVIRNCQWLFVRISSQTKWSGVIFSWKPQHDKHLGKANSFVCTGVDRNVEASMYFMFYQTRLLFALLFKLA